MIGLAFVIGIVAGLRVTMAVTAIAWAAAAHGLPLEESWLAIFGWHFTPWIFSLIAFVELVTDQLPTTPSRKVPVQFGARLLSGGVSGVAIGIGTGTVWTGLVLGLFGAAIGTYGGAAVRASMARAFGRDRPAALIEDAVAIAGALLVYVAL